ADAAIVGCGALSPGRIGSDRDEYLVSPERFSRHDGGIRTPGDGRRGMGWQRGDQRAGTVRRPGELPLCGYGGAVVSRAVCVDVVFARGGRCRGEAHDPVGASALAWARGCGWRACALT